MQDRMLLYPRVAILFFDCHEMFLHSIKQSSIMDYNNIISLSCYDDCELKQKKKKERINWLCLTLIICHPKAINIDQYDNYFCVNIFARFTRQMYLTWGTVTFSGRHLWSYTSKMVPFRMVSYNLTLALEQVILPNDHWVYY